MKEILLDNANFPSTVEYKRAEHENTKHNMYDEPHHEDAEIITGPKGLRIWTPPIDIYETDEYIIVECKLKGMSRKDIRVTITDKDDLAIHGKTNNNESRADEFRRIVPLPMKYVDQDKISAKYEKGLLTVKIMKQ